MDAIGDFFPLIVFALYLLLKLRKSGRRAPAPPPPRPVRQPARDTAGPTPFEQLLARLEEAAAEAAEPSRTVVPEPRREFARSEAPADARPADARPVAARPEADLFARNRAAVEADRARAAEAAAFHSAEAPGGDRDAGFESETRGFEREGGFEQARVGERGAFDGPHEASALDAPLRTSHADAPPAAGGPLGSPQALRDAFVLSTILDRRPPPRRPRRA